MFGRFKICRLVRYKVVLYMNDLYVRHIQRINIFGYHFSIFLFFSVILYFSVEGFALIYINSLITVSGTFYS